MLILFFGMTIPETQKPPPGWQGKVQDPKEIRWLPDLGSNQGPAD